MNFRHWSCWSKNVSAVRVIPSALEKHSVESSNASLLDFCSLVCFCDKLGHGMEEEGGKKGKKSSSLLREPRYFIIILYLLSVDMCIYSFNQRKDGQTYHDLSTNMNYTTIIEYKLRELRFLTTMHPCGRIAGVCCGG